uniref:Uncharacterized protein n=1 Tax=Oryza meridionalis TaxID=40149 RepID=A0A0E0DBQ1_9ORYZ
MWGRRDEGGEARRFFAIRRGVRCDGGADYGGGSRLPHIAVPAPTALHRVSAAHRSPPRCHCAYALPLFQRRRRPCCSGSPRLFSFRPPATDAATPGSDSSSPPPTPPPSTPTPVSVWRTATSLSPSALARADY